MSGFSELLESYIQRCGLTQEELAQSSGFSRSFIALMKSGQRMPSPDRYKSMAQLMDAMGLSPDESDRLWRSLERCRTGEVKYAQWQEIIRLLDSEKTVSQSDKKDIRSVRGGSDKIYLCQKRQEIINGVRRCALLKLRKIQTAYPSWLRIRHGLERWLMSVISGRSVLNKSSALTGWIRRTI